MTVRLGLLANVIHLMDRWQTQYQIESQWQVNTSAIYVTAAGE